MQSILSLSLDSLEIIMKNLDQPLYRAKQIFRALHNQRISTFDDILNIPKNLREELKKKFFIYGSKVLKRFDSSRDNTRKYLLELYDGEIVEAVFMAYNDRNSVCISSQVGCNMGCVFCASTKGGKARNLTAGEMLEQIYLIEKDNSRVGNIVVMGQGEPLDNFMNLIDFLRIITDANGANKSARKITVSTCGIPDKIIELAKLDIPVTLAFSLHRTTDEAREKLMPINKVYKISEVLDALKYYYEKTGRRVSFEYMVIGGENDSIEDARRLKEFVRYTKAHINILELNPIKEYSNKGINNRAREFAQILVEEGINATFRNSRGADIEGACGQLRRQWKDEDKV